MRPRIRGLSSPNRCPAVQLPRPEAVRLASVGAAPTPPTTTPRRPRAPIRRRLASRNLPHQRHQRILVHVVEASRQNIARGGGILRLARVLQVHAEDSRGGPAPIAYPARTLLPQDPLAIVHVELPGRQRNLHRPRRARQQSGRGRRQGRGGSGHPLPRGRGNRRFARPQRLQRVPHGRGRRGSLRLSRAAPTALRAQTDPWTRSGTTSLPKNMRMYFA